MAFVAVILATAPSAAAPTPKASYAATTAGISYSDATVLADPRAERGRGAGVEGQALISGPSGAFGAFLADGWNQLDLALALFTSLVLAFNPSLCTAALSSLPVSVPLLSKSNMSKALRKPPVATRLDELLHAAPAVGACDVLQLTVTVTNAGTRAGDEVVQLYLTQLNASAPVPQPPASVHAGEASQLSWHCERRARMSRPGAEARGAWVLSGVGAEGMSGAATM